jgi:uncharacterized protein YecE (DUF72 family)
VPKQFAHVNRLADVAVFKRFVVEASALGDRLGPLLLQLPPSFVFRAEATRVLLEAVRDCFPGSLVCASKTYKSPSQR